MSYTVVSGDTLSEIAQRFGTTYQELALINGIQNPDKIEVGQVLKLPNSSSSSYNLTYEVVSGDTLGKIAKKFGTTYQEIALINGIPNPDKIEVGQILKLPNSSSPSSCNITYEVVDGDTLGKIAKKFGTTYQEIANINGISNPDKIQIGQVLKIPGSISSSNSSSSSQNSSSSFTTYEIVGGDTLSKIAQRFGTSYQELARINGIENPDKIKVGQVIKSPGLNTSKSQPPLDPNSASKPPSNPNSNSNQIVVHSDNTKVLDALKNSPWKSKADSLSVAFYTLRDNGYSVECAIGLMANLVAEGNYGIVEYAFSKSHSFDFYLPSGGVKCKTIADIEYVKNWTTSNVDSGNSKWKKGSCGFGSVQWSFERRVNFAKLCLTIMKKDSDVNDNNWSIAEATFIIQELKNGYYKKIEKAAIEAGGSVEAWAEAFTDRYEIPAGADRNMTATGSACIKRRKFAKDIYEYLENSNALD